MGHTAETTLTSSETRASVRLARFFPQLQPVQTRAFLTLPRTGSAYFQEAVLVEFAAAKKLIFSAIFSLEFGDTVRLANEAGDEVEAKVIAVQFQDGRTAVAAQVLSGQLSWVSRP